MNIEYKPKITELPLEERPGEKLKKYGPSTLKNSELLAIILGRGTKKEGVLEITKRMVETGKVMGIDILDHIIIGKNGFTSLKEEGLM